MKILITGASGYLGSHLLESNLLEGHSVTAIYRKNKINIINKVSFDQIQFDIYKETLSEIASGFDLLIHLAWNGLPNYFSRHHFEEELPSQYRFLSHIIKNGLKNLVVVGTCFEYGMVNGSLDEEMETKPANPYGYAKDCLRKQLEFLQKESPFRLVWARLFYSYGTGQSPNSLYTQYKEAALQKKVEFPMSGGEQLRDFLPVEKQIELILKLSLDENSNGIYNVCSGKPTSVLRLVQGWMAEEKHKLELKLGQYPYPNYEPFAFWGNAQKINEFLR